MMFVLSRIKFLFAAALFVVVQSSAWAQCHQVFDFYGEASSSPYWYNCTGLGYTFNLQSPDTWGPYSIDWGDGTPNTTGSSWTTPQFISHTYAQAIDTFVVSITEINTGCVVTGVLVMEKASSASIQIPVGGLTQACAPQVMEFINSSTNVSETTVFTWDFGDGTQPLVFDYTNWHQTIPHLYDVGTVDCETVVTLTAENYCNTIQGGHSTATFNPIRIWDIDDAAISASSTLLCYPDTTVTFTNTTERNCLFQGNIYQRYEYWNFGDFWNLGHDSIVDWTPWPPTFPHTIHFPGVGEYTISMLDSNYCGIAPANITIRIVPPPIAGIDVSADTVCLGESITFYQQATGGANSYQWNFGNGTGWLPTGSGNITYTFTQPGEYLVQSRVAVLGSSSGCSDIDSVRVWVLPRPTVLVAADDNRGCDNLQVNYTATTTGAVQWNWNFDVAPNSYSGQTPPTIFYNNVGQFNTTLTVTGSNGCTSSDDINVRVLRAPTALFSVTDLCVGDTAHFIDLSTQNSSNDIDTWRWNFGDGGTSTQRNPYHYYANAGTYNVRLIIDNGSCRDTLIQSVNVQAATAASATSDITQGCSPLTVNFTNLTSGAASFLWEFGDGSSSTDSLPSHTFLNTSNNTRVFTVILHAYNAFGCGGVDTLHISVYPGAIAAFTDNTTIPGCSPFDAQFTNLSQNASSYLWNLGDGTTSTATNPTKLYINNTGVLASYNITLIAFSANGCNDTTSHPILIYPLADFSFSLNGATGCAPLTLTMPYVSGAQSFDWSFGDGGSSNFPMPTHTFLNTGSQPIDYTVSLMGVSAFGCSDTATAVVTVNPGPQAIFNTDVVNGCGPLTVTFVNTSVNGTMYSWDYGDFTSSTDSSAVHTHTFINPGTQPRTYVVTLTVTNGPGCSSQFSIPIQVYPNVTADFNLPNPQCSPAALFIDNTSTHAEQFNWDLGNGQQSADINPTITFTNNTDSAVTYHIGLQATSSYGCNAMAYGDFTVYPNPNADFDLSNTASCSPSVIDIINYSTGASQYNWNYDDGSFSQENAATHSHTFFSNGNGNTEYIIRLNASNSFGCADTASRTLVVYPQVIAAFSSAPSGCSPFPAALINQSVGAVSFEWSFGDGTASVENNPTHTFTTSNTQDSNYTIQLIAQNAFGCSDTATRDITIFHTPIAIAQVDTSLGCYPRVVTFANASIGADSYQWVYGTGSTSTTSDSLHTFTYYNFGNTLTTYNVLLNAYTANGCQSQDNLLVDVSPGIQAAFTSPDQGCSPFSVTMDNQSTGAFSYYWNFGDGSISNDIEPQHSFINNNATDTTYLVTLIVQNEYGCADTTSRNITVFHKPFALASVDTILGCYPKTVTFYNGSTGADSYQWVYGNGSVSATSDLYHTVTFYNLGTTEATYNVTLTASTSNGCQSQANLSIQVSPPITAAFANLGQGCSPLAVNFDNMSEGADSYAWNFGDGVTSNAFEPLYSFSNNSLNDTTYVVTLIASNQYGCSDTISRPITIFHSPVAVAAIDSTSGCYPKSVTFFNGSIGADSYQWVYGTGTVSNTADLYHTITYYNFGTTQATYNVTLNAITNNGCQSQANLTINVSPPINAEFAFQQQGCSPLVVYFDNQSDGGYSYHWNFGDGDVSTQIEPEHNFFNYGTTDTTYHVTLIIQNQFGCSDTTDANVVVYARPNAGFTATPDLQTWPDATVQIGNNSIGSSLNFEWNMGNGTTLYVANPNSYTYQTWGEYTIRLIASNGTCSDTTFQSLTILPPAPVANFEGPAEGCAPLTVQFTSTSENVVMSMWQFGDGGQANATNPVYTYWQPGTYTVTLTVTGYDGTTETITQEQIIHVYPSAVAAFTVTPNEVNVPDQPVYCLNLSSNSSTYTWDFGDGSTSSEVNPLYYYTEEGVFDVTLIANNQYNCPDTMVVVDAVHAKAGGLIDFPNAFTPKPDGGNGGIYDAMGFENDVFFPMHAGVDEYVLQIFNKWGELLFESKDVNRGWDGYYRGQLCKQDVYVWKVKARLVDGQIYEKAGDVTLLIK